MERRLARARQTARVRVARDELRRMRELSHAIDALETEIADLVGQVAPHLLAEPGCGPLTAAKLIGEIAGAARFAGDAKLARAAGLAPIPVSSGKTNCHRLDRGGNRQVNAAIHRIAVTRAACHPETRDYIARKRAEGKTTCEAIRCLKRQLARRIWVSCSRRSRQRLPHFLDIDGMCRPGSVQADVYHHRPHSGLAYRTREKSRPRGKITTTSQSQRPDRQTPTGSTPDRCRWEVGRDRRMPGIHVARASR